MTESKCAASTSTSVVVSSTSLVAPPITPASAIAAITDAAAKGDDTVPIRRIVLYRSGVGYFERVGGTGYEGRCFVFDERVALTPDLRPVLDGPSLR